MRVCEQHDIDVMNPAIDEQRNEPRVGAATVDEDDVTRNAECERIALADIEHGQRGKEDVAACHDKRGQQRNHRGDADRHATTASGKQRDGDHRRAESDDDRRHLWRRERAGKYRRAVVDSRRQAMEKRHQLQE